MPISKKALWFRGLIIFGSGLAVNTAFVAWNIGGVLRELSRITVLVGLFMLIIGGIIKIVKAIKR
ncbi:MAG: hypothetical protein ABH857_04055 [Elusimicrobiota bacterium]